MRAAPPARVLSLSEIPVTDFLSLLGITSTGDLLSCIGSWLVCAAVAAAILRNSSTSND